MNFPQSDGVSGRLKAGNELESLRAEEKLEEYRILRRLTALLRDDLHDIEEDYRIAAEADALQSIALFAGKMSMSPPEVNQKNYMRIVNGRHPLLWKALRKENREHDIIPLDIEIGKDHSGMVITGSNAGGKTVALKTIGILNLMALSGMHIPAGSGTILPFLDRIYADIGDDQSIDRNLSTFSAHIKRISEILQQSGEHTLVIIDELGTGTDPEQGGALSCAILRQLKSKNVLTVVSTHLGMLKAFAHSEPGMINSAMEMEEIDLNGTKSYRPTYNLIVGEPGTSHAFEIAESLGLQEDVIKDARQLISGEDIKIESLISDLKMKTGSAEKRLREAEELRKEADVLRSSLEMELSKIKSSKHETLSKAFSEAEEIVRRTRTEVHEIIRQLKKAKQSETAGVIMDLDRKHLEIKNAQSKFSPDLFRKLREVSVGQNALIRTLGINGVIQSINEKTGKCTVMAKGKEMKKRVETRLLLFICKERF